MEKENKPKRARQTNCSVQEEVTLISAVICHYDILFGSFSGSSRGASEKQETWKLVVDAFNAVSVSERTLDGIEKKFSNIKQSAKAKRDVQRQHPPTGGGRRPIFTPAEEMWINALEQRKNPTIHGVFGGVDANELNEMYNNENIIQPFEFNNETGYTFNINQGDLPAILAMPIENMPLVSSTITNVATTTNLQTSTNLQTATIKPKTNESIDFNTEYTSSRDVRRKRKKISEDKDSLELDILRLEKEKVSLQNEYLRNKLSSFEQRKSLWKLKEAFYKKCLSSPED